MRTSVVRASILGLILSAAIATPALAQVHGVTPLNCPAGPSDTVPNNPNAGGQRTVGTPAHSSQGGPVTAPIPINTGNAPFTSNSGDAGQHSSHCR